MNRDTTQPGLFHDPSAIAVGQAWRFVLNAEHVRNPLEENNSLVSTSEKKKNRPLHASSQQPQQLNNNGTSSQRKTLSFLGYTPALLVC
jgi:hypothetical protein